MAVLEILVPVLYALAMLVLLVYALNLYWLSVRFVDIDRTRPGSIPDIDALPAHSGAWPRVTVQLPVYNEAVVVERLIDACARFDYPQKQLEIQVLDDSTDITCELAETRVEYWRKRGVDILHVRRSERTGYKAGALGNGLRFARGDFIAIFDADFVPEPDFLRRTLPMFDSPDIGLVQARWTHLNETDSLLTRVQAFGLDTHFALEQQVRHSAGYFMNFNGTAGVWRRECIEEAGGWNADTLTEDLDLSYRAQLAGWRLRYLQDVEVAAELPAIANAFRSQQFRWAKGSIQTAMRQLPALWRSSEQAAIKLEGTVHLTAHMVFPFVLLAGLLHAPLVALKAAGRGPGEVYFALLGLGLVGLAGFFLAQLYAQRSLYHDWVSRLRLFPSFMAGSMGMSINNTRAVWQALRGRTTPFVRTPKFSTMQPSSRHGKPEYADRRLPGIVWMEVAALLYCVAGIVVVVAVAQWAALPFQILLASGFGLVVWFSVRDRLMPLHGSPHVKQVDEMNRTKYLAPV